jgi:hypothetical protein
LPFLALLAATASAEARTNGFHDVRGSTLRLSEGRLLVGTNDGGVVALDNRGSVLFRAPGLEKAPVSDIVWLGRSPWWITGQSSHLHSGNGDGEIVDLDLGNAGLGSPIRRLGVWKDLVAVHGDAGVVFVDPRTRQTLSTDQVLPPDVAPVVAQGVMMSSWTNGSGLLVANRRYGQKDKPDVPGAIQDIAMLTAWSFASDGSHRLLGSYCGSLVEFRDAAGPRVKIDIGSCHIDNSRGTADVSNLRIGPEGVIALTKRDALAIPFFRDSWLPSSITTTVPPSYAKNSSYAGSSLWWADGGKIVQSSLEDGSSDLYVPIKDSGRVLGVAADDEGAFALTEEAGIVRIRPGQSVPAPGFLRVALAEESDDASPKRLKEALAVASRLPAARLKGLGRPRVLKQFLKSQKVQVRPQALRGELGELRYGDIVETRDGAAIYIGSGKLACFADGEMQTHPFDPDQPFQVIRIVAPSSLSATDFHVGSGNLLTDVFPIGLGKPNPSLDTDRFCTWHPDRPEDLPTTPQQIQLREMLDGWIGVPYRWAGASMEGTDCSGLVNALYAELGIKLPRHSQDIGRAPFGEVVVDELHFGDVLVFPSPKHCAIYVGNGQIIEAIRGGVTYSPITRYSKAIVRRFLGVDSAKR